MGKNRKFKNQYVITVEGVTTNGSQAEQFDKLLRGLVHLLAVNSQQTQATVKVLESSGDYDAEIQSMKEEQ